MKHFFCLVLLNILVINFCKAQTYSEGTYQQLGAKKTHVKAIGMFSVDSVFELPKDTLASAVNGSIAIKNGTLYKKSSGVWGGVSGGSGLNFGEKDTTQTAGRYVNQNGNQFIYKNGTVRLGGTSNVGAEFSYDWSQTPLGGVWSTTGTTITAASSKTRLNGTISLTANIYTGVPVWHFNFTFITRVKSTSTQKISFALIPPITSAFCTRKFEFNLRQDSGYINYFTNSAATIPDATGHGASYLTWAAMDTFDCSGYFTNGLIKAEMRNRANGQRANLEYDIATPQGNISQLIISSIGDFDMLGTVNYYVDMPFRPQFLATGNSTTVGYGAGASSYGATWVSQLFSKYDNIYAVAAGSTERTAQALLRIPEFRNFIKPTRVLYDYGINDLLNSVTATTFAANTDSFCRAMLDSGIYTVLIAVPPQAVNNTTYNDSLQAIAARHGLIYVDISTPLKGGSGGTDRDPAFNYDGVHYNDTGYELWASVVEKKIQSLLYSRPTLINDKIRVSKNYLYDAYVNSNGEIVAYPDGASNKYLKNLAWQNGNTFSNAQNASLFIQGSLFAGGTGALGGSTSVPMIKWDNSVINLQSTTAAAFSSSNFSTSAGTSQFNGSHLFWAGSADNFCFQPFQINIFNPTGNAITSGLVIDNITSNYLNATDKPLDIRKSGTTVFQVYRDGDFRTGKASGYDHNINGTLSTNDFITKKYSDSLYTLATDTTISYGTWTPAVTTGSNTSSFSSQTGHYTKVGNEVTFTVYGSLTATAGSAACVFDLSLPIASNFTAFSDALGNGMVTFAGINEGCFIKANSTDDRFQVTTTTVSSTSARDVFITGHYTIK